MLEQITESYLELLRTELPNVLFIDAYPKINKKIKLPAILLEVSDFASASETEEGKLSVDVRWTAYVVVDTNNQDEETLDYHNMCRAISLDVLRTVTKAGRLGYANMTRPTELSASEDGLKPELDGYHVFSAEWVTTIEFGDSVWDEDITITPSEIYLSFTPYLGPDYIDHYKKIN